MHETTLEAVRAAARAAHGARAGGWTYAVAAPALLADGDAGEAAARLSGAGESFRVRAQHVDAGDARAAQRALADLLHEAGVRASVALLYVSQSGAGAVVMTVTVASRESER